MNHPPMSPLAKGGHRGCNSVLIDACRDLVYKGYIEIKGGFLRLTRKGIVISNTIIVKLFERLGL